MEIFLNDIPMRPVVAKGFAGVPVQFNQGNVLETSRFDTKRLTASTCAKFQRC
jgi:hypothetical protein